MNSEQVLEQLLMELREMRARLEEGPSLPAALKRTRAARELSISVRKLRDMERSGDILTCEIGDSTMIPRSEVERLSAPVRSTPKPRTSGGRPRARSSAEEAQALRRALRKPKD
jgi:hypothetical protein